jgi:hypothetical protein|tara:strand:- start:15 stop:197 length:183 start_codon:yes stop_codon:yes gene_type:complete
MKPLEAVEEEGAEEASETETPVSELIQVKRRPLKNDTPIKKYKVGSTDLVAEDVDDEQPE